MAGLIRMIKLLFKALSNLFEGAADFIRQAGEAWWETVNSLANKLMSLVKNLFQWSHSSHLDIWKGEGTAEDWLVACLSWLLLILFVSGAVLSTKRISAWIERKTAPREVDREPDEDQSRRRVNFKSHRWLRAMVIGQFLMFGLEILRQIFYPSAADAAVNDPWQSDAALMVVIGVLGLTLVLNLISLVGLYFLRNWARWLYLVTSVVPVAFTLVSPASFYDDWLANGAWISSMLSLGILIHAFGPGGLSKVSSQD